jgi:hypothetical protein
VGGKRRQQRPKQCHCVVWGGRGDKGDVRRATDQRNGETLTVSNGVAAVPVALPGWALRLVGLSSPRPPPPEEAPAMADAREGMGDAGAA